MTIDWFTTGAQIVNFLILVWLLKKLLFKPIINAMERREQGLASRLQQAKTKMHQAQALEIQYKKHLQQLQIEKDQVLSQAKLQAEAEKAQLLQSLSADIQQKRNQFDTEIRKQQQELQPLISRMIVEKSLKLSHKTLTELADQTLEQRIIEHFLQHLSDLQNDAQTSIKQALIKGHPAIIMTSIKLDTETQKQIQMWFEVFAPGSKLLFEQRDYLVSGIVLEIDGRCWEWNVDRYLTEMGTELLK